MKKPVRCKVYVRKDEGSEKICEKKTRRVVIRAFSLKLLSHAQKLPGIKNQIQAYLFCPILKIWKAKTSPQKDAFFNPMFAN